MNNGPPISHILVTEEANPGRFDKPTTMIRIYQENAIKCW